MDVSELILVQPFEQCDEIRHAMARTDCLAKAVDDCSLVIDLGIGHLVDLLLYDAQLLQVLRVLAMVRDQFTKVLLHFL